MKINVPTEDQEQKALISWLNYHPILKNFYFKTNNEGKRTVVQGWNLKLQGLKVGVSDLFIFYPTELYHGLFLEVKRNKNYTKSEMSTKTWIAELEFLEQVKSVGYQAFMCYGWMDGKRIIEEYLD